MKIYSKKLEYITRINIRHSSEPTYHINLYETTQEEVLDFVKEALKDSIPATTPKKTKVTSIEVRKNQDNKNGRSISYSLKGLTTKEVYDLLMTKLKN